MVLVGSLEPSSLNDGGVILGFFLAINIIIFIFQIVFRYLCELSGSILGFSKIPRLRVINRDPAELCPYLSCGLRLCIDCSESESGCTR